MSYFDFSGFFVNGSGAIGGQNAVLSVPMINRCLSGNSWKFSVLRQPILMCEFVEGIVTMALFEIRQIL